MSKTEYINAINRRLNGICKTWQLKTIFHFVKGYTNGDDGCE